MSSLLSFEQMQAVAVGHAPKWRDVETVPVEEAVGRVMAQNLHAKRAQPAADLSAMDGYAIAGEGPWQRVGESRAGAPFVGAIEDGECTRISTGAHMPEGSDRVLIQENAEVDGDAVHLREGEALPSPGQHVRPRGFDFSEGDQVLASFGEAIGAGQLALMLAAGIKTVDLFARAHVAILECGDELCADGGDCDPHQIPATNGAMIEALLRETGCIIERSDPVPDDMDALMEALERHANADILLISGGASVGDHDLVQQALVNWGAEVRAWKVAIKPGKPIMVATRGDLAILGLPGNPVSSFVTAFLFALPMVRKAMGLSEVDHPTLQVPLKEPLPANGKRREFLRGRVFAGTVRLAGSQDSSALRALANANCLIDRPIDAPAAHAGDMVTVYPLQNGGFAGVSAQAGA